VLTGLMFNQRVKSAVLSMAPMRPIGRHRYFL